MVKLFIKLYPRKRYGTFFQKDLPMDSHRMLQKYHITFDS